MDSDHPDGRVLGHHHWSAHHPHPHWAPTFSDSVSTSWTLPVTADELYLISRGAYHSGRVNVKQSLDRADHVQVDVRVAYHDERALGRVSVCRLEKSGNRQGIGIHTPSTMRSDWRDRLYIEVDWSFPGPISARSPLAIKAFTTHAPNFVHTFGDLWQSLLFEIINVDASNAHIQTNSITLTRGTLSSTNGDITGHFNTSDALTLRTSNAHIDATASLFSAGGHPTKLEMRTSNGHIASSVSLITESGSGGDFVVTARSSNGTVKLRYDDAPLETHLVSDARTSNGQASVVVHPAFEGQYEVSTSNSRPVVRDTHPADPSGAHRRRVVDQNPTSSRNTITGNVYWAAAGGSRRRMESTCVVSTSNAPVSLDL